MGNKHYTNFLRYSVQIAISYLQLSHSKSSGTLFHGSKAILWFCFPARVNKSNYCDTKESNRNRKANGQSSAVVSEIINFSLFSSKLAILQSNTS